MIGDLLHRTYLGNSISNYLLFLLLFLAGVVIVRIIELIVLKKLTAWAKKTKTTVDDFLVEMTKKTVLPLLYYLVFYSSIRVLTLGRSAKKAFDIIGIALLTVFVIRFVIALINYVLLRYWMKKEEDETKKRTVKAIMPIVKVVLWGVGITFLLDNLGIRISTVIAGLGIGGIAVALAAQAILGDLFSYFAILLDKPFEIGDFIVIDNFMGNVEHVGIKTTRIRSLTGEQLVFSNTDLTNSRVRNYKRMERRRVLFRIGVTYDTGLENLKAIPGIIRGIIESIEDTLVDRVHFASFGDYSLIFEVVYYVLSSDYGKYMDIQQEINLRIMEEFEKRGIEFAFPTQTVYLESQVEGVPERK